MSHIHVYIICTIVRHNYLTICCDYYRLGTTGYTTIVTHIHVNYTHVLHVVILTFVVVWLRIHLENVKVAWRKLWYFDGWETKCNFTCIMVTQISRVVHQHFADQILLIQEILIIHHLLTGTEKQSVVVYTSTSPMPRFSVGYPNNHHPSKYIPQVPWYFA